MAVITQYLYKSVLIILIFMFRQSLSFKVSSKGFFSFPFSSSSSSSSSSTTSLSASKHLVALKVKAGEEIKADIVIDPKKEAMLERLGLNNDQIINTVKTGAQLRKERKLEQIKSQGGKKTLTSSGKKDRERKKEEKENKIRFKLGNGADALTSSSLLQLVRNTAPYFFPVPENPLYFIVYILI